MKEFLKMTLAVICGMFVMTIIGFFLLVGFVGALSSSETTPVLPRSGVLKIDMSQFAMTEKSSVPNPLAIIQGNYVSTVSILKAVQAINFAAEDPTVKVIYLKTDKAQSGVSHIEELRKALVNFRASGKPVIAYMESPSTASYYLASMADKVFMSSYHGGGPMINGVGSQMFFLKDILSKLGVNVQLIRHGKYKSAGEMFIKNAPSDENILQTKEMINSLWQSIAGEIAESRGISADSLSLWVDNLSLATNEDMLNKRLVDELVTKEELREKLEVYSEDEDFDSSKLINFSDYVSAKVHQNVKAKNKIAVIYASGEIVENGSAENIVGDSYVSMIDEISRDENVKAVVLRVASPGGSVLASDKIRVAIDKLREKVPVIASYGSYAASGGYWISSSCDKIFSDKTTLTGSIGVFSMIPDFSKTAKDILHVGVYSATSNKHGDMYSLMRPLSAEEEAYFQKSVDDIYTSFVSRVSSGRDLKPEYVDSIAQGRVWAGAMAHELKLVDEIGTLEDAIKFAQSSVPEITDWQIEEYPKPLSELESIMAMFDKAARKEDVLSKTPFKAIGETFRNWNFDKSNHLYARMPYEYVIE